MALSCRKRTITLLWGLLECLFFAGILNGWIWMQHILKEDGYYVDSCNSTLTPESHDAAINSDIGMEFLPWIKCRLIRVEVKDPKGFTLPPHASWTTEPLPAVRPFIQPISNNVTKTYCDAQDNDLELIFSLVVIIRNVLMLPLGIFLDRFGTCRTRILAISFSTFGSLTMVLNVSRLIPLFLYFRSFSTFGSLTMLFSSADFPWTTLPALTLLGTSGYLILLTDLQIGNLYGARRYTVMSLFVGAYFSGGLTPMLIMTTRKHGINLQTSFMFITIGIIPVLISTISMLPRSRIPWPLPIDYGKKRSGVNREEKKSAQTVAWQRRISAGRKKRENSGKFCDILRSPHYIWLVVWFCILSLKTFVYDMNVDVLLRSLHIPGGEQHVKQYITIYALVLMCSLLASPFIGVVMDWNKRFVQEPVKEQMKNILHATIITYVISLGSSLTSLIPSIDVQIVSFICVMVEKVALFATTCAFLNHVHFPSEHFGKSMGLTIACSGVVLLIQFPLKTLIYTSFHQDTFYVYLILLLSLLVAVGHPVNVYYQCHVGNIHDVTASLEPQKWTTPMLMENITEIDEEVKHVVPKQKPIVKTRLQVTDL